MNEILKDLDLLLLLLGILIGIAILKFQGRTSKTDLLQSRIDSASKNYEKLISLTLQREFADEKGQYSPIWLAKLEDEITQAGLSAIKTAAED